MSVLERSLVDHITTVSNVGINKDLDEVVKYRFLHTVVYDAKAPGLQWLRVGFEEFLATKVPATTDTRVQLRTIELNLGVW
jgi:hypothetical protein